MEGFEWIERIPVFLRWILFLPAVVIIYFLMRVIALFTLSYGIGPEDDGFFSYISYTFYYNFLCVGFSLMISCLMVPKGKLIVASIYVGILLILIGMGINGILNGNDLKIPIWKVIYETICTLGGYILALVFVYLNDREIKNKAITDQYTT